ncbi:tetratricopeptide repeat protein [Undibacterium sp. CY18W]|uniref:Tetratricopeptide repeat protein n=1 Tax=Undibacterium hunanense TaxID=2762292 RepID=A0ABR6ZKE9_9BURK|nr:tetratricopeptide repeat protein [Undibacterium hunanense]MBC3916333.1 tetratricopeptide repeat protein [Undibacterium hunanense]
MKTWIILLFASLLTACASQPSQKLSGLQLNDQGFGPASTSINAEDVMALSKEMHAYLKNDIATQLRGKSPQKALFDALSTKGQIKLEYDAEMTRNAAQAFSARSGNCLSLVLMTAALAKELGMDVQFQNVLMDESWSRNNDIYFAAGHVNIVLGNKSGFRHSTQEYSQSMVIDFLPPRDLRGQRAELIREATVIAMYFNNRAAESLAQHQVNDAYWFARAALMSDPDFIAAYNTLGVVYRQHGDLALSEVVFKQILSKERENTMALSNLIEVLRKADRLPEAQLYADRLANLQPNAPFHYFNRGLAAMDRGEYAEAKALFKREIKRDPNYDEFHLWLALAHLKLGETPDAIAELTLAQANSTTRKAQNLYAGKLERIKAAYH